MTQLTCGCERGRSMCSEAERLWRAHVAVPNDLEHLDEQRATLAAYWRHWGESEASAARMAREMLQ